MPEIVCFVCTRAGLCACKQMERSSCGGRLSPAAQAKYVHDWENRTGNTNMFTKARIGWHGSDDTT